MLKSVGGGAKLLRTRPTCRKRPSAAFKKIGSPGASSRSVADTAEYSCGAPDSQPAIPATVSDAPRPLAANWLWTAKTPHAISDSQVAVPRMNFRVCMGENSMLWPIAWRESRKLSQTPPSSATPSLNASVEVINLDGLFRRLRTLTCSEPRPSGKNCRNCSTRRLSPASQVY